MTNSFTAHSLGQVTEIFAGGDKPKKFSSVRTTDYKIPVYANGETRDGLQGFTDVARVNVPAVTVSARGTIGYASLRKEPFLPIVRLLTLIPDSKLLDVSYLYYYLRLYRQAGIGSSQAQIIVPDLASRSISIPSLSIQKAVVKTLSAIDNKITHNNKINAELEKTAWLIFDYWFAQFDFPDESSRPYNSSGGVMAYHSDIKRKIPAGWKVAKLEELIDFDRGISYTSKDIASGVGLPMINLASIDVNRNYRPDELKFHAGKFSRKKIVNHNDMLMACTDLTRNADIIGSPILVPNQYPEYLYSMDLSKINILDEIINDMYLYMSLRTESYHNYIKWFASGTNVLHLDLNGVGWYPLVIPPIKLQKSFATILAPIKKQQTEIITQNQELTQLRDWLLPMLMTGQVTTV